MKFAGWVGLVVGVMMVLQWGFFIAAGAVPELETEPVRIAFHLAAELVTAVGLASSGLAVLKRWPWGVKAFPIFSGMLLYSVIVSPGYFAQQGQWIFVAMFALVLALAVAALRPFWAMPENNDSVV